MMYVAKEPGIETGTLTHQVASLHYFDSEQPLVNKIIGEVSEKVYPKIERFF